MIIITPNLPRPDLGLHLPGLSGVPPEHQQPRGQAVQSETGDPCRAGAGLIHSSVPVNCSEVLETLLLCENEDHRVVPALSNQMRLVTGLTNQMEVVTNQIKH